MKLLIKYSLSTILLMNSLFLVGGAKGCENTAPYVSANKNGRSNKLEHNAPPQTDDEANEEGNNDSLNRELFTFSCEDSIQKEDEQFRSFYEDGFNHFGAFLLYYQQKIQAVGWQKSQAELKSHINTNCIDNYAPNQYCGVPLVGALKKADQELNNPHLRRTWKNWCEKPQNFLSWMLVPLTGAKVKNGDVAALPKNWRGGNELNVAFFDDGFAFFKWISDVGEYACYSGRKPDPKKWCD